MIIQVGVRLTAQKINFKVVAQNPETLQLQKIAGVAMLLLETKDGHHLTVIKENQVLIEGKM